MQLCRIYFVVVVVLHQFISQSFNQSFKDFKVYAQRKSLLHCVSENYSETLTDLACCNSDNFWDSKSPLFQQRLCQKLPKVLNVLKVKVYNTVVVVKTQCRSTESEEWGMS